MTTHEASIKGAAGYASPPLARAAVEPLVPSQAAREVVARVPCFTSGPGVPIWRAEEGQTRGLTTAASILSVAAIGVVTGVGLYLTAILGTALALAILEFDRLLGLHGLHRRVTGRPDMDDEDQS